MKRFRYTEEMLAFLQENRKKMTAKKLTDAFNRRFDTTKKVDSITAICNKNGWHSAICGKFTKGFTPHNHGTKGLKLGIMKPNSGSFKKGMISQCKLPVGTERIDSKDGYIMVKIADPSQWRQKHYIVWEATHGPMPKGFIIRFKNGDKTNCDPDNLELLSHLEHLRLNKHGYTTAPDELKPVIKALAKVESRLFEATKRIEHVQTT